jgi:hypothetical protein
VSRESLPAATTRFIFESIQSVEQIEILLLLASDAARDWSAEGVAKELRSSPRSAERWLENLRSQRLVTSATNSPTTFRFAPQSDELRATVTELAEVYASHRVAIIELIFNKPAARMKSFADAFKLREDK